MFIPILTCALISRVVQWNPINISLSIASTQHNHERNYYLLGNILPEHVEWTFHVLLCLPYQWDGKSFANYLQPMACIAGIDAALCLDRSQSSFVWSAISDQQHRQYQRYPWCILRSVRMFVIEALFENEIQIWWSICIWIIDGSTSMRNLQHFVKSTESFLKAQLEIHCNKNELQRTNESDTATYADSVTIKTNAFGFPNCWINSERKDHPVLF